MKKNVLITLLILVSAASIVFGYIKADSASKASAQVEEYRLEAERMREEAMNMQSHAQRAASEAREAQMEAERAIQDCLNNK